MQLSRYIGLYNELILQGLKPYFITLVDIFVGNSRDFVKSRQIAIFHHFERILICALVDLHDICKTASYIYFSLYHKMLPLNIVPKDG